MILRPRIKRALSWLFCGVCLCLKSVAVAEPITSVKEIGECWKTNFSPNSSLDTIVELSMKLSRDGKVEEVIVVDPERFNHDDAFNALSNELGKALVECGPYKFPDDLHDDWKVMNIRFDPSKMFGQ
ncbi:hypothetical protein [Kiloniella litopenaei]|uniref:hypothetical protein n=1 Tax=Kiloniella litopenaei TaxID=1549748 RepID=UPI0012FF59A3|nr:hypothetical protein [Kiloniella litopenaei]